jgi:hypothetical protein
VRRRSAAAGSSIRRCRTVERRASAAVAVRPERQATRFTAKHHVSFVRNVAMCSTCKWPIAGSLGASSPVARRVGIHAALPSPNVRSTPPSGPQAPGCVSSR